MANLFESQILKYPRTRHLEDSRLQPGDEDMEGAPFHALRRGEVAYEEKIDGANCGFRFDGAGDPYGQSRGHYLNLYDKSIERERDFNLFKDWILAHRDTLLERFEDRYVVYGEWMQVTHSIFYDRLPHLFLEFDIYDRSQECFLDTPERRKLCKGLPFSPVPVLYRGPATSLAHMKSLVGPSCFKTPVIRDGSAEPVTDWRHNLRRACAIVNDDYDKRIVKMDPSDRSEGLYIKVEKDGRVIDRYKWVNPDFSQVVRNANEHWQSRFPVPNLLNGVTDIFPDYLARDLKEVGLCDYDPDAPWIASPWIAAREPAPVPGLS